MAHIRFRSMLLVACTLSAMSVSSAGASMFSSSEVGKLTAKALGAQIFTTEAGKIECKGVSLISGNATRLTEDISISVEYSGCKAFGLTATVTPALYLLLSNGTWHNQLTITVNAGAGNCVVRIAKQVWHGLVIFANIVHGINAIVHASSLKYTTEGVACAVQGTFVNGTYDGEILMGLASGVGTIKWEA